MFRLLLLVSLLFSPLYAAYDIIVTLAPTKFLIDNITQKELTVRTLVPPGVDPHTFELNAKELIMLSKAKLWFAIGEGWENRAKKTLCQHMACYNLREAIPPSLLLPGDSHIWLSCTLLKYQTEKILAVLSELYPERAPFYHQNAQHLLTQLDALDQKLKAITSTAKNRTFIAAHAAFGYFSSDYGFTQLSIEDHGKEASPQYILNLITEAKNANVSLIVITPEQSTKEAVVLASNLNCTLVTLDPYLEDVLTNLEAIAKGLSQ